MHRRTTIVNAIAAALIPLDTAGTARVFTGRVHPIHVDELPAVNVRNGDEIAELEDDRGGANFQNQLRRFEVVVELHVASETDIDQRADDLALEVERILNPLGLTSPPGLPVDWFRYASSGEPERDGEIEQTVIARELVYQMAYRVDLPDPQ